VLRYARVTARRAARVPRLVNTDGHVLVIRDGHVLVV
jgi:hypothetical protein